MEGYYWKSDSRVEGAGKSGHCRLCPNQFIAKIDVISYSTKA